MDHKLPPLVETNHGTLPFSLRLWREKIRDGMWNFTFGAMVGAEID